MNSLRFVSVLVCASSVLARAQENPRSVALHKGSMDPKSTPLVVKFALPDSSIGATVNLFLNDPQNVDLDMDVYYRDPSADSSALAICSSYGDTALETCRALTRSAHDTLWVRVFPSDGQRGSGFRLEYVPLYGKRIEGTLLTTKDARRLQVNQTYTGAFRSFGSSRDPLRQLFRLDGLEGRGSDSLFATLLPLSRGDLVRLAVFDSAGRLLRTSRGPSESQQIRIDTPGAWSSPLYVLAELTSRRGSFSFVSGSGFRLRVGQDALRIPITLSSLPFRDEGSGERCPRAVRFGWRFPSVARQHDGARGRHGDPAGTSRACAARGHRPERPH